MDCYLSEQDVGMKREIKDKIETLKSEIAEAEKATTEAQNFEKDFDEFIIYAFDIMDNLGTKWLQEDKATIRVYKQMLFPSGIQPSPDKKVYIPEISPIYRYGSNRKAPEEANFTRLEGPLGSQQRSCCSAAWPCSGQAPVRGRALPNPKCFAFSGFGSAGMLQKKTPTAW